jgi:hypothetical protein
VSLSITHSYVSANGDPADPTLIGQTKWNAAHTLTGSANSLITFPLDLAPGANTSAVTGSSYSLTGSDAHPMFDLSGTWNTSGTPTAIKLNVTDTASDSSSLLLDLQVGGATKLNVNKIGTLTSAGNILCGGGNSIGTAGGVLSINQNGVFVYNATGQIAFGNPNDVIITRDAANTLALRNGTNAQDFRIYQTYTDASNYSRGEFGFFGNDFGIISVAAGTGTGGKIILSPSNGIVQITSGSVLSLGGRTKLAYTGTDGNMVFTDSTGATFGLLTLGPETSSFPALKRSGTAVQVRLADDSADAPLHVGSLRINAAPSAVGSGSKTISNGADSSTNFGHYFSINLNGTTYYIPCSATAPT